MLPPAGRSCSDTCTMVELQFGYVFRGDYHLVTCPISPGMCYKCDKYLFEYNDKCMNATYHEYAFNWSGKYEFNHTHHQHARAWRNKCSVSQIICDWLCPRIFLGLATIAYIFARGHIIKPAAFGVGLLFGMRIMV